MVNMREGKKGRGRPHKEATSSLKESPLVSPSSASCAVGIVSEPVRDGVILEDSPISSPDLHEGFDLLRGSNEGKLDWDTLSVLEKEDNLYGFVPPPVKAAIDLIRQSSTPHALSLLEVVGEYGTRNSSGVQSREIEQLDLGMGSMAQDGNVDVHIAKPEQSWRDLFLEKQRLGEKLQFHAPTRVGAKVVVKPPQEAVDEGITKWESSLVGQFLAKSLPFWLVKRTMNAFWGQFGKVETFFLENGLFLFKFDDIQSRDSVFEARIWHVANKPLILRKWQPGLQPMDLPLKEIPVWIKILRLPIEYWNPTCLSYVASGVGKPLYANASTEANSRLGFARVFVEVDISAQFLKEIEVDMENGHSFVVGIEYPWIPVKCTKCSVFGYLTRNCGATGPSSHGNKVKKQWVPKLQIGHKDTTSVTSVQIEQSKQNLKDRSPQISMGKENINSNHNRFAALNDVTREDTENVGFSSPSKGFSNLTIQQVIEEALESSSKLKFHSKKSRGLRGGGEGSTGKAADIPSIKLIKEGLEEFRMLSGLSINQSKSEVFCANVPSDLQAQIFSILQFRAGYNSYNQSLIASNYSGLVFSYFQKRLLKLLNKDLTSSFGKGKKEVGVVSRFLGNRSAFQSRKEAWA